MIVPPVVRGFASGILATGVMSAAMLAAQRTGTIGELPPRRIVDHLAPGLGDDAAKAAATALHLGIGAASGSAFAASVSSCRASAGTGAAFCLLLWAAGYQVLVPLLGVLPPAHLDRRSRVVVMIGAHLVYGGAIGWAVRRGRTTRSSSASRSSGVERDPRCSGPRRRIRRANREPPMIRPLQSRGGASTAPVNRFELLAAVVEAETDRSGDRIGYQHAIIEILRCLNDVDQGRLQPGASIDRIYEHIAQAVPIDPFERRSVSG